MVGLYQLSQAARWLRKQFESRAIILMYHSIANVGSDPWGLRVQPSHFAEHLAVLREHACPMSLQQLVQAQQAEKIPNRAVVVTFDDGYADNLYNAKPLLEKYNVPATIFVASGWVGKAYEFWWDELDRVLLQPGRLPQSLDLNINDHIYHWDLDQAADYSEDDYRRYRYHNVWQSKPGSRLAFYYSIWQLLRLLPQDQRQQAMEDIRIWARAEPAVRSTHRSLSVEEVRLLEVGELIEIGAHTISHPFLSAHPTASQWDEIWQSKVQLEEIFNHPVTSFSYPHGDYTVETLRLIEEAGFMCACSIVAESVWKKSDRFQLPRFDVQDWSGAEFHKRLLQWFHH